MCMTEMILYSSFTGLLKQNEPQGFFFVVLLFASFWQERDKTKNLLNSHVHKHSLLWATGSDPPIQLTLLA